MMVDAVIAVIAVSVEENIPVIVTDTGWQTDPEADVIRNYAERYLTELVKHLKSGMGTPLRKEGAARAYIYELFDDGGESRYNSPMNGTSGDAVHRSRSEHHWGIMYSNKTMKFKFDLSRSVLGNEGSLILLLSPSLLRSCLQPGIVDFINKLSEIPLHDHLGFRNSTKELITCCTESHLGEVVDKVVNHHVHRAWVIDESGMLSGVISLTDIIRVIRVALLA